jgi:hypothetical protein
LPAHIADDDCSGADRFAFSLQLNFVTWNIGKNTRHMSVGFLGQEDLSGRCGTLKARRHVDRIS